MIDSTTHVTTPEQPSTIPVSIQLLPSRLAAKALCISERSLWSITSPRGPLQCCRIGKSVRYRVADLEAYLENFAVSRN